LEGRAYIDAGDEENLPPARSAAASAAIEAEIERSLLKS
jgi:hypothetical protein